MIRGPHLDCLIGLGFLLADLRFPHLSDVELYELSLKA